MASLQRSRRRPFKLDCSYSKALKSTLFKNSLQKSHFFHFVKRESKRFLHEISSLRSHFSEEFVMKNRKAHFSFYYCPTPNHQKDSTMDDAQKKLPILTYLDNHHLNFCCCCLSVSRRANAFFCWKLLLWRQANAVVFTSDFKKWFSNRKMQSRKALQKIESPKGSI